MSYQCHEDTEFSDLLGKTLVAATHNDAEDVVRLVASNGDRYVMYHDQDCCENVSVESIVGDLSDLIGSPILQAEEVTHSGETPEGVTPPEYPDSYTWTFYKLGTIKGGVTIRWLGESNGYYSESVSLRIERA